MNSRISRLSAMLRQGRVPDFKFHLQQARRNWRRRSTAFKDMISIVSTQPAIVLTGCHPRKLVVYLQPPLRRLALTIFYRAGWSLEHQATFVDRISAIKSAQRRFPQHRYIFAVNTPHEFELVSREGIRAEFLNENAFIDEFSFQPDPTVRKEYDAILDAQIARYKRVELAADVRSLLVITFVMEERFNAGYAKMVRECLAHADWANGPFWESTYRKLNRQEVAEAYRKARVGLCLSEMEGANLASIQYLLSGLAVVSTESQGGRDIFFESDYARIVKPDAQAVGDAVDYLVRHAPPPDEIRGRTLEKIWNIRGHFAELLTRELGHPAVDAGWWREFNANRRIMYQDLRLVAKTVAEANAPS